LVQGSIFFISLEKLRKRSKKKKGPGTIESVT
jgi:hypothetical protein